MPSIVPHPPLEYRDGAPYSSLYGDTFKSRAGGLAEALEVFVRGCRLTERWAGRERFTVLECGFGVGANFCATLRAWRDDPARPACLHYVAIEHHPVSARDLGEALRSLGAAASDVRELVARWPLPLPGMHRIELAGARVRLTLVLGEASQALRSLALAADAIYLDGFAPARNPAMWSSDVCRALARLAAGDVMLATYSASSGVRESLAAAGFEAWREPGFGGKRHRTVARLAPRAWQRPRGGAARPAPRDREAVVVGAGLAGCAVAAALAARGWAVTVLEGRAGPALGGSGQPRCADHLHLSPDDNFLARLTRAALLLARNTGWACGGEDSAGRLQVAVDEADEARHAALLERLRFPAGYVRAVSASEAADIARAPLRRGALWLPLATTASPAERCGTWLGAAGERLRFRDACTAASLEHDGERWRVRDDQGAVIACAGVVILAAAGGTPALAGPTLPSLRRVDGQTTTVEADALRGLRCTLGGPAYACPLGNERVLVGASFVEVAADDAAGAEVPADDRSNLARLARVAALDAGAMSIVDGGSTRGTRWVAPDRLPLVGAPVDAEALVRNEAAHRRDDRLALARRPGLYVASAFGSRGLLWSVLAAELLAATICDEPLPVERELAAAVDPARFLRRALRRGHDLGLAAGVAT